MKYRIRRRRRRRKRRRTCEIFEELRGIGAVNVAMVACDGDCHRFLNAKVAVLQLHNFGSGGGDCEDGSRARRKYGIELWQGE
jgi:hypothetical protein